MRARRRGLFAPILALLALALSRAASLYVPYFSLDETEYAVAGMVLKRGGLLYRDIAIHHPPLILWLYEGVFRVFGDWNLFALHGVMIAVVLASAGLLFRRGGIGAIALYGAGLAAFWAKDVQAANVEILLNFFLIAAAAAWWSGAAALAGGLWAMGMLTKFHALFFLPAVVIAGWRSPRCLVGFALVATVVFALAGGLCLHAGIARETFQEVFVRAGAYAREPLQGLTWGRFFWEEMPYEFSKAVLRTTLWGGLTAVLWLGVWRRWRRAEREASDQFAWYWLSGMLLSVFIGGRMFWHYFLLTLPPAVWLAAPELSRSKADRRVVFAATITGAAVVFFQAQAWLSPGYARDAEIKVLAQFIEEHTAPDDKIWVWGFLPQVYVEAKRQPATRFVQCDPLVGVSRRTPGQFAGYANLWQRIAADMSGRLGENAKLALQPSRQTRAWQQFWTDVQAHPPVLIVDAYEHRFSRYALLDREVFRELDEWMEREYQAVGKMHGFVLRAKRISHP